MKTRDSFLLHKAQLDPLTELTIEDKGKIFNAIIKYQFEGVVPKLSPILQMAFSYIKNQLDIDNGKYESVCERNKKNGMKGGRPKKPKKPDNDNDNENDKDKDNDNGKENFTPPDFSEVLSEFKKKIKIQGLSFDPESETTMFLSHYESTGWKKIEKWEPLVTKWIEKGKKFNSKNLTNGNGKRTVSKIATEDEHLADRI